MNELVKNKEEMAALMAAIETRIDYLTDCGTDEIYQLSPATARGTVTEVKKQVDKNMDELMNLVRVHTRLKVTEGNV